MIHPFVQKYRELFSRMWRKVASHNAPYVLAIARKGPRLFDLFDEMAVRERGRPIIISERALPFIEFGSSSVKVLPIIDDVVIYGSTMQDIVDSVRDKGADPRPYCLVYDADKARFREPEYEKLMSHQDVVTFCHQIPSAFSLLGIAYDVDHPLLFLDDIGPEIMNDLRRVTHSIDLSSSLQKKNGIMNLVCHIGAPAALLTLTDPSNTDFRISISKVRMIYDSRKSRLCVVPILVCEAKVGSTDEPVFIHGCPDEIMGKALEILRQRSSSQAEVEEGAYRVLVYVMEYAFGLSFLQGLLGLLARDVFAKRLLREDDAALLFGESFGLFLIETLESNKEALISELQSTPERLQPSIERLGEADQVQNVELFKELFEGPEYQGINKVLEWNNEAACVRNICRLMREKDLLTRDPEKHIRNRLKFGFTFRDFVVVIRAKYPSVRPMYLSVAFDYLVDRGVIVPLFLKYPTGYFVRAFRFGESSNNTPEQLRAYYVHDVLDSFSKSTGSDTLSQFDFEKLFSYLHDLFKGTEIPVSPEESLDYDSLRIQKQYDEFGARVFAEAFSRMDEEGPTGNVPLIREAVQNKILVETRDGFKLDRSSWQILFSENSPLSSIEGDMQLYTNFWADLCFGKERPHPRKDEVALLLTTCNKPINFLTAYKVGIYAWFSHTEVRFSKILSDAKVLVHRRITAREQWTTVDGALHDLAARLVQSAIKKSVWSKACVITQKIDKWSERDKYRNGIWKKVRKGLIALASFTDAEQAPYDQLSMLYPMCRSATNVLRAALSHVGVTSPRAGDATGLEDHVRTYNRLAQDYGHLFPRPLQKITLEAGESSNLDTLKRIIDVLESNYSTMYSKFDEVKRYDEARDVKCDELDRDMAIVMYDMKGYSDWTERERERMAGVIDHHMRPYLASLDEAKYYKSVLNDENAWVISDMVKALKASHKLLEITRGEKKTCRVAIHHTSPNDRVVIYKGEGGHAVGGHCFIVCARLRERAEELEKSRKEVANTILLTRDAHSKLPDEILRNVQVAGPFETLAQGKSIGEIEYYEVNEEKLRAALAPSSDWRKMFKVR